MADVHAYYLRDLGNLLREHAEKAKQDEMAATGTSDAQFMMGRAMAYYEVVSLLKNQARAFGLPLEDISFDGFDPEAMFVRDKK